MKKAGIFLILLAFLCVGQGFGPKIVKGPMPSNLSGASHAPMTDYLFGWWIANSNCFFSVDGTEVATNTGIMKYWGDFTGHGLNLTNTAGGPRLYTNVINNLAAVCFDTNAFTLLIYPAVGFLMSQPFWIFMVAERTGDGADQKVINMIDANTVSVNAQTAPQGYTYGGGVGNYFNAFVLNVPFAYGLLFSNAQSYAITNSVPIAPVAIGDGNAVHFEVGGAGNSDRIYRGFVAEILVYTNFLNSNSVWKVTDYLTNKYALHP